MALICRPNPAAAVLVSIHVVYLLVHRSFLDKIEIFAMAFFVSAS